MALRKKKEESTNDKIVRLYQEGKSVADICAEVSLRNDIVTGVIQRKLGADAVPDAVIPHEKNHAAEVIAAESSVSAAPVQEPAAEPEKSPSEDLENMSKLERYMFEKKRKLEQEQSSFTAPEPVEVKAAEIPAPPVVEPVNTEPEAPVSLSAPEPAEEVHRVSLVEEYMMRSSGSSSSSSDMEGISLVPTTDTESVSKVPSYTIPSAGESYAEMDALVPPDVEAVDISDAPILTYDPTAEPAAEEVTETAETAEGASAESFSFTSTASASEPEVDKAGKAADKMKAFALSQIEANNAKIAELEAKCETVKNDFTSRIDEANTALTLSQSSFDTIESQLNEAYAATEKAREENKLAIAKAEEEYNRKMSAIDEEYRAAIFEANNKFQEFDDRNRETIMKLDSEKAAAQADLVVKRKAVADVHAEIGSEKEKLEAQITALKEENAGYQAFIG